MSAIRGIARGVAKNRMAKRGMKKFCKHDHFGYGWQVQRIGSTFSRKWKEAVGWR